ncbi:MAG: hypothetical protein ER33_01070 [Cyanobium sp. CACIAM 14]|nr:MAG: hypothetical protein ER33_01070 [Cyanobium sp. CACIAM 14]
MKVLHILPPGGMSWGGGIPATLTSLAEAPELAWVSFRQVPLEEAEVEIRTWAPDLFLWHPACSWRLLPGLFRLGRGRSLPGIGLEHHYCEGFERLKVPSQRRFRTLLRLSYGCLDRLVCVSHGQARWVTAARLADPNRVRVIPFSRTLDDFFQLPLDREEHRPFRLGAYGRFVEQKGFQALIEAVLLLPRGTVELRLGGGGELDSSLRQKADRHPDIHFHGPLTDVPAFLAACDAVAVPSLWEPWGNVCLEARAAGRPVIVTAVDGLSEQVDGERGLLVPSGSPQDLAEAIADLAARPPERLRAMAEAARRSALPSWSDFTGSWNHLLREYR